MFAIAEKAIAKGYMKFNWDNYADTDNFYVLNPSGILNLITGVKWEVRKVNAPYKPKTGEYAVEFWSLDGSSGHFARISKGFNSLQSSKCVNKGKIYSYRICKVVA